MFRSGSARSKLLRCTAMASVCVILGACSTLPVSGPTGREILHSARRTSTDPTAGLPFKVVEVTSGAELPLVTEVPQSTLVPAPPQPTDLIGPGDVLNITIYEAGVSLFGRPATRLSSAGG